MRLVTLWRDGVINQLPPGGVGTPEDWIALPGSLEAIARLNHAGYKVVITANQHKPADGAPGVGAANAIHARMHQLLGRVGGHVDAIFICPHDPQDNCNCRPDQPTLYRCIGERFSVDLAGMPVVSHEPAHLEAARKVGASPMHIGRCGPGEPGADFPCFDDLGQLVEQLLKER